MRFVTEDVTFKYSTVPLRIEEWVLLPTYQGRRIARLRTGIIPPKIKEVWLATAILTITKGKYKNTTSNANPTVELVEIWI